MVDADALLEKDLVTLDEALQIANNAVLMALNAISILTSELNRKYLDIPHESMKELGVTDLKKILGSYKEAKIGYGVGYDVETSVVRAIYDCPFLGSGVKIKIRPPNTKGRLEILQVYARNGRISMAGVTTGNVDYLAKAIHQVTRVV